MNVAQQEQVLQGESVSRGVAIGACYHFTYSSVEVRERPIVMKELTAEMERFRHALIQSGREISQLKCELEEEGGRDAALILEAQLQLVTDPLLIAEVETKIGERLICAEVVFRDALAEYEKRFQALADPFFRERFKDLEDLARRVLRHLVGSSAGLLADAPEGAVVFTTELTPSDTASVQACDVAAFVTEHGGSTSHAAIVAKAKGIPFVTRVDFSQLSGPIKGPVVVDGRLGQVIVNPKPDTLARYQKIHRRLHNLMTVLAGQSNLKAETFDGYDVRLTANLDEVRELSLFRHYGVQGVGLFRSEYLYLGQQKMPDEEEQYQGYSKVVHALQGYSVVFRIFDLGGDKHALGDWMYQEANPYFGCRAIRLLLKRPDIFRPHLRAVLRASALGKVSLLLPFVSALSELREVKAIIEEERALLIEKGYSIPNRVRLGCMIEVPSAALIAEHLGQECDFLSIGTNDLVQYALAVDRTNQSLGEYYTSLHPGVLRLISDVVRHARLCGVPVSLCGEMAADPRCTILLLGLGLSDFSAATRSLPLIRHVIRRTSVVQARRVAQQILTFSSAQEVIEVLQQEYHRLVPEDCLYNMGHSTVLS